MAITLLTTGCLYGVYSLYALWVTPLVQREQKAVAESTPKKPRKRTGQGRKSAEAVKYLPQTPWTWHAKYQTRTGDRLIFMQEWEPTPDGNVQLTPFAMIIMNAEEPDRPPYTLVSNSAVLQFEHPFELTGAEPGRVVGGSLNGKVEIHGPDRLLLRGRNFFFQENPLQNFEVNPLEKNSPRAWSDGWVYFEYDGHRGKGNGLELNLIPQQRVVSRDKPAVDGIRTVRLLKNVELHLLQKSDKPGRPPERVQINSKGPFEFDLITHIATFEDEVHVVRRTVDNERDTLDGDALTLIFEQETEAGKPGRVKPSSGKIAGNLKFRRMRADGKRVELVSTESQLTAQMQQLTYDAQTRTIVLRDDRQRRNVVVKLKTNELRCPELTLKQNENGEIVDALGRGAGKMYEKDPETNLHVFEAKWEKQIWKHPDPRSTQQVIEFHGKAMLKEPWKMVLEADVIKIWMEQTRGATLERSRASAPKDGSAAAADNLNIQRLLALGDVAFASPKLLGGVQKLEIWFEEGKIPPADMAMRSRGEPRDRLTSVTYRVPRLRRPSSIARPSGPFRRQSPTRERLKRKSHKSAQVRSAQAFASTNDDTPGSIVPGGIVPGGIVPGGIVPGGIVPGGIVPGGIVPGGNPVILPGIGRPEQPRELEPEKPVEQTEPIDIVADRMQVRVIRENGENHVSKIRTYGHVDVIQKHIDGGEPLRIKSHQLSMLNQDRSGTHQIIWIKGKPATGTTPAITAHVYDRGTHLEGINIKTDRRRNWVWVTGAGLMQTPIYNTLDGKPLIVPELLSVWWREKMNFDGTVAKFYDNVRIVHEGNTLSCGEMYVTLTDKLSFIESGAPDKKPPKLRKVVCKDGVRFHGSQYEENRLVGKHRGEVFELTMNQQTGEMLATGGGEIETWRRESQEQTPKKPSITTLLNGAVAPPREHDWSYSKVTFRGKMTGNLSNINDSDSTTTTQFHEDVVVVYGPVRLPTEVIDPDDLPENGGILESDVLRVRRIARPGKSQEPYLTMRGWGNARLTGKTYFGRAEDVTYDQAKGQYILRTPKPYHSWVWEQTKEMDRPNVHKGQAVIVYPEENKFKVINGKSLDVRQ